MIMSNLLEAIKSLKSSQRFLALLIIAILTSITAITTVYFKTDDCRVIIDENIKMHKDFATISKMLRDLRMERDEIEIPPADCGSGADSSALPKSEVPEKIMDSSYIDVLNEIEKITISNQK